MFRGDPNHAEYRKLSLNGGAAGPCGDIHPNSVEHRTSLAFSGPTSRYYVVLELCGMDFSISVQVEYAMFGRDQGVGTGRLEQNQAEIPAFSKMSWPVPATTSEELLEWLLAAPVKVATPL